MDDILEAFVLESVDLLEQCAEMFAKCKNNGEPIDFRKLMRHLHTLKGNAQYLHLDAFTSLTHEIESIVIAAQGKAIPVDLLDFLMELVYTLTDWTQCVMNQSIPEKIPDALMKKISLTQNKLQTEKKTILIVDDDTELLEMLKKTFTSDAFASFEPALLLASNGSEGLSLAEKNQPDLIVTDLVMPNIDGLNFIKKIRGMDHLKEVPIVFTSGYFEA